MALVTRESLLSLEVYSQSRPEIRRKMIEHKRTRALGLGEHVTLLFEDEHTIRYQVQEMLRAEKIFEAEGIAHELDSYNPLVPTGSNFKATMLIEYEDAAVRAHELTLLKGIERRVWLQVEGAAKVYPITDEDMERENETKTSAVHFMRWELNSDMVAALKYGVALSFGIDHSHYQVAVNPINSVVREALLKDLA
jgi:Protein of unknown function (DUF3501)